MAPANTNSYTNNVFWQKRTQFSFWAVIFVFKFKDVCVAFRLAKSHRRTVSVIRWTKESTDFNRYSMRCHADVPHKVHINVMQLQFVCVSLQKDFIETAHALV